MGYKDFKNGGQAESSGGCLKKVGGGGGMLELPYELWSVFFLIYINDLSDNF